MEFDVVIVGAGPAGLSAAIRRMQQAEADGQELNICIVEKGSEVGAHILSGAVMNPKGISELVPDFTEQGFPTEHVCTDAMTYIFTRNRAIKSPMNLPNFRKRGYHVVSLNNVVKWLAERCEAAGIEIYPGFAGAEILTEGNRVIGVRMGDMGIDKDGQPKSNFEPGMDILAKITVLGEGVRGSLAKQLIQKFNLEGERPQVFETGVKEIWRVKPEKHQPGRVIHGSLFPDFFNQINGMWLYDMKDNLVSFGFVTPLASENPNNDPHLASQIFKTTPFMRDLLEGAGARLVGRPGGTHAIHAGGQRPTREDRIEAHGRRDVVRNGHLPKRPIGAEVALQPP